MTAHYTDRGMFITFNVNGVPRNFYLPPYLSVQAVQNYTRELMEYYA